MGIESLTLPVCDFLRKAGKINPIILAVNVQLLWSWTEMVDDFSQNSGLYRPLILGFRLVE